MVRVKSSQKSFTEEEVTTLTGICAEHLRHLAQNKHLGTLARRRRKTGFQPLRPDDRELAAAPLPALDSLSGSPCHEPLPHRTLPAYPRIC